MKSRLPLLFACVVVSIIGSQVHAQTYNVYFGDFHSQSWYSDGNKDQDTNTYKKPVAKAITYARTVASNMNFLGVSDHNHNESLNMTLARWRAGNFEADSVNQDGVFVGMYGQEWGTISGGGHVLVYGTNKLFGWNPGVYDVYVAKSDYTHLFDSVKKYNGFCYLAHPNPSDYNSIFSTAYKPLWDSVIQGVSLKNGPALTANYTESAPASGDYATQYHDLLRLGYHVAPAANQDNHYTNFGNCNQQRTGVLATSLTRANVFDALRNRRAYATEDHNLQLHFEVGSHQMGELFTTSSPVSFRVKITDPGETISRIELRYGIPGSGTAPTTLTTVLNSDSLIFSQPQPNATTYYYYVYVQEADGNKAWSAPMWITTSTLPPPGAFALLTPVNSASSQPVSGSLTWQSSSNATGYDVYLGTTTPPTTLVSSNQAGTSYSYSGLVGGTQYFWKVVARNASGTLDATGSPWNFTTVANPPGAFALSSPSDGASGQPLSGNLTWGASTNALAYDVYLGTNNPPTTIVSPDQAGTTYGYSGLANNTPYFWKVIAKNGAQTTTATGSPRSFTTVLNAPSSFSQLSPANNATHQPLSGNLSWQTSTNATGYSVYFGTINPPPLVSFNQVPTTYAYGPLTTNAIYYWKIIAKNATDSTTATGAPWNFTSIAPPDSFLLVSPLSGATGSPISGMLTWDTSGHASSYDLYLDVNDPPTVKFDSNLVGTTYPYDQLLPNTTYYWKIIAKNVDGTITASNAPFHFTTVNVPVAPTGLFVSDDTTTSLTLHWTDNATNENGYRVYRSQLSDGPFFQIGADLPTNTQTFSDTGLNSNERYYYQVAGFNLDGEGLPGTTNVSTLAMIPGAPTLSLLSGLSINVTIDPSSNPSNTKFAIRAVVDTVVAYVQQNGSLLASPDWKTYSEWGGLAGVAVHGLQACTLYTFDGKARNGDNTETAFGASASQQLSCYSFTGNVVSGWNLLSVPLFASNYQKSFLFPNSTSSAFRYEHSYIRTDTMRRGIGYWLKFAAPDSISFSGDPSTADTFDLASGWNIIGSISYPVYKGSILQEPGIILSSNYFGYNGAYFIADSLFPMQGYWVKASTSGRLIVSSSTNQPVAKFVVPEQSNTVSSFTFEDRAGFKRTMYIDEHPSSQKPIGNFDLPPSAPEGSFDVRFTTNEYSASLSGIDKQEFPITLQSSSYPVTLTWSLADQHSRYTLITGSMKKQLVGTGSETIAQETKTLSLVASFSDQSTQPKTFALYQNYPNPFNPSTEIRYDLPISSRIRLTVLTPLGTTVATLVDEVQSEGQHRIQWTPAIASGVYFYRIEANSLDNPAFSYRNVLRAILLK